jgi:AcrR family transcriptional regulator
MGGKRKSRTTGNGDPTGPTARARLEKALARVAAGATVADVCRSLGISRTTFYRWKRGRFPNGPEGRRD